MSLANKLQDNGIIHCMPKKHLHLEIKYYTYTEERRPLQAGDSSKASGRQRQLCARSHDGLN